MMNGNGSENIDRLIDEYWFIDQGYMYGWLIEIYKHAYYQHKGTTSQKRKKNAAEEVPPQTLLSNELIDFFCRAHCLEFFSYERFVCLQEGINRAYRELACSVYQATLTASLHNKKRSHSDLQVNRANPASLMINYLVVTFFFLWLLR